MRSLLRHLYFCDGAENTRLNLKGKKKEDCYEFIITIQTGSHARPTHIFVPGVTRGNRFPFATSADSLTRLTKSWIDYAIPMGTQRNIPQQHRAVIRRAYSFGKIEHGFACTVLKA